MTDRPLTIDVLEILKQARRQNAEGYLAGAIQSILDYLVCEHTPRAEAQGQQSEASGQAEHGALNPAPSGSTVSPPTADATAGQDAAAGCQSDVRAQSNVQGEQGDTVQPLASRPPEAADSGGHFISRAIRG